MAEEQNVRINDSVDVVVVGRFYDPVTNTEKLLTVRTQDDGSLRLHALQIVVDSDGRERTVSGEAGGEMRTVPMIHDGTSLVRILAEANRTAGVSLHATDTGGTVRGIENETTGELRIVTLPWTPERPLQLDAVLVPNSQGVLLDGSASLTSAGVYEVSFVIVNIDGTNAVTVSVGVDLAAGGALAAAEFYMTDVVVPAGGSTGVHTITMAADDDIRGVAGAANDAAIHFTRVIRVA